MRIAYVVENYRAQSELWIERQIEMLKDDISFIAAADNGEKYWNNFIPIVNLYSNYPLMKRLAIKLRLIRTRSPIERNNEILLKKLGKGVDIIFVNFLTLAYRLQDALNEADLPLIIHTHGYDITWDLMSLDTMQRRYDEDYFAFVKNISKKALLIANSNESKHRLSELGVDDSRIFVKKFGVSIERSETIDKGNISVKILYIGRLVDCKAPDLVIRAFELACERGLQGELIVAGDGPLEVTCRLIQMRSKYRDRIKLLGVVNAEEGQKLRRQCDIFTAHNCKGVLTNQIEAFGVSIIEAMSAGLPVVTGRSGGVVDSIIDGETGFLVEPGDIDEHAERLLQLAVDPGLRARMGEMALERVRNNFSIEGEEACLRVILRSCIEDYQPIE